MKHVRYLAIATLAVGLCGAAFYAYTAADPEADTPEEERFPVVARYELPRDYGYFIGDDIPLTLVVETNGSIVLDLVNLPQKGDKHGLFEVRDLHISSTTLNETSKVYRASYRLQYFGVTPLTVEFEGLELLYARANDQPGSRDLSAYKSVFTQPIAINVSRIGPFRPTPPMDIKGPLDLHRRGLLWLGYGLAVAALGTILGSGLRQWHRHVQQQRAVVYEKPSTAATTLHVLQQEGAAFQQVDVPAVSVVSRLDHLIRHYVQETYGIPAFSSTARELTSNMPDGPYDQELLFLLERCEDLKHQPPEMAQMDERQLWWEAMTLFEKLQRDDLS